MKKSSTIKYVLTWLLISLVGMSANVFAQTDVTNTYLTNANFNTSCNYLVTDGGNLATAGDGSTVLDVVGWTGVQTAGFNAAATFEYGTSATLNGAAVPATGPNSENGSGEGSFGFSQSWGGKTVYTQDVTLPAGTYTINYKYYNANTATLGSSLFGWIPDTGSSAMSSLTSFTSGAWTSDQIVFSLTREATGKIQVGVQSPGSGSGSNAKVFFDGLQILYDPVVTTDATLSDITLDAGSLIPAFDWATTNYTVVIPSGVTTINVTPVLHDPSASYTGGGAIDVSGGETVATITVTAQNGITTNDYTITFVPDCYTPEFADRANLVPDPLCNDRSAFGGWGSVSATTDPTEVYCGTSSMKLGVGSTGCDAALDISGFNYDPNTTYRVRAMVKTVSGSIGFLASGANPNFGYGINTNGVWAQIDTFFTTGASPSNNFITFNKCDFSSNCTYAYIDNYEIYKVDNDASLSNLTTSTGSLSPAFASGTTSYEIIVDPSVTDVTLTATASSSNATVTGDGVVSAPGTANILVTAESGNTRTYTVKISSVSTDATLSGITLSAGSLVPDFDSGTTSYLVDVPNGTSSIDVNATKSNANATIESGTGTVTLTNGIGSTDILVTAEDGTTKITYTIVFKEECFVPYYSSGNMIEDPTFSSGTLADGGYGGWGPTGITVDGAYCGIGAAFIRGSCWPDGGSIDRSLNATNGNALKPNTSYRLRAMINSQATPGTVFQIQVEGYDGTKSIYFDINGTNGWEQFDKVFTTGSTVVEKGIYFNGCSGDRGLVSPAVTDTCFIDNYELYDISGDASLKSLSSNVGTLSPAFDPDVTDYHLIYHEENKSVTVNAGALDPNASVVGTGSYAVSSTDTIHVVVTSKDGTATKTYNLKLQLENLLDDVRLDDLSCDKGFLDPLYDDAVDNYSVVLPGGIQMVKLHAETHDSGATVTGGGDIDVSSGSATATVVVTGEDGTTTRTITVSFTVSDVNYAMSLPGGPDGRYSNVTIPALNVDHLPMTIELWVKPDAAESGANRATVWYSRNAGSNHTGYGFQYDYNTDISKVQAVWDGQAELPTAAPIPGQWNHLALVITSTSKTFYINGVPFTESGTSYAVNHFFDELYLGWDNVDFTNPAQRGRTLKGEFDEFRVWNVARTAQEIKDNEYKRLNGNEAGLIGYWNFDNHHSQYATDGTKITAGHQLALNGEIHGGTYVVSDLFDTMTYDSSACVQASTDSVGVGAMAEPVAKLIINTSNSKSPYVLKSLDLNVDGTTDIADVDSVSVYYTPDDHFNTNLKFGKLALTDASFTITGEQQLGSGANYFWVAFDVADSATIDNVVDAACTSFTIDNSTAMVLAPTTTDLDGNRKIVGKVAQPIYRIVQNASNLVLGEDSNDQSAKLYNYDDGDQSQVFNLVETNKEGQYYLISSDGTRYLHVIGSWNMGFVANPTTLNNDYRFIIKHNVDGTIYLQSATRPDRYVGTNSSNPGISGVYFDKPQNNLCVWRLEPADGATNKSVATLAGINMDKGSLVPGFSPFVTSYSAYYPQGTDTVNVEAMATNPDADVSGDGAIDVSSGNAVATITVASADGTATQTYTIEFNEQPEIQMTHSYTFDDGTADDMVGNADGVLQGDAAVADGALTLSGTGYVSLPAGEINISSYGSVTVETIFKQAAGLAGEPNNTSLFCFGRTNTDPGWNMGVDYLFYQPTNNNHASRLAVSCLNYGNPWSTETGINDTKEITDAIYHYLVVIANANKLKMYLDGSLVGTADFSGDNALSNISDAAAYIGRNVYLDDPLWKGSLDEMSIYQGEMDAATIAQRATQLLGSASRDASLASLTVDTGELSPAFDASKVTYYVTVPKGTSSVNIDANATDANATVTGTGAVDVSSGSGIATVVVTAEDGKTQQTYTVNISQQEDVTLTHSYTFDDGTAADVVGNADGTLMGSGAIADGAYTAAANGDYIELPAADIAINTYSAITLEGYIYSDVDNTGNNMMAYFGGNENGLGGNGYFLTPDRRTESRTAISCGNVSQPWTVEQGFTGDPVSVGAKHHVVSVLTNSSIKWYIDGALAGEAEVSGGNSIANLSNANAWLCRGGYDADPTWMGTIDEFNIYNGALDSTTIKDHAQSYLGGMNSDARLSALTTDTGTLLPEFNNSTTNYAVEVPEGTTTVNLAATPLVPSATVTGDGAVDVSGGEATANIEVTSVDGTVTKTYTVYIKVNDPNCFSPLFDSGNMIEDPEFSAGTLANGGFGGWGPTGITVTEAYCGIGSAYIRGTCYPDGGSIDRSLNADNGNALKPNTTYRLRAMINSQASPDTYFQFQVEGVDGDNSLLFNLPNTNGWVQFDTTFTTSATVTEHGIYFNSCSDATPAITDTCFIDNYELYEVSSDASLFDLQVDGLTVDGFDASTTSYDVVVPKGTTSVNVSAMASDASASLDGTGDVDVSSGSGAATVTVTSGDGTATMTYTVNITVDTNTAVNNLEASLFKVYPTVTSGTFHVAFDGVKKGMITVYNLYGQVVLQRVVKSTIENVNVPTAGVYLIKVQADGADKVVKVLKTE